MYNCGEFPFSCKSIRKVEAGQLCQVKRARAQSVFPKVFSEVEVRALQQTATLLNHVFMV